MQRIDFATLEESYGQKEIGLTAKAQRREEKFFVFLAYLAGEIHRREQEYREFSQREI